MADDTETGADHGLRSPLRRKLLMGLAGAPALALMPRSAWAAPPTSAVNTTGLAVTDSEVTVGIMGLGVLGRDAAEGLRRLGFKVAGWSRTAKPMPGIETFHGSDGFQRFLDRRHGTGIAQRAQAHRPHLAAARQKIGLLVGLRAEDGDRHQRHRLCGQRSARACPWAPRRRTRS